MDLVPRKSGFHGISVSKSLPDYLLLPHIFDDRGPATVPTELVFDDLQFEPGGYVVNVLPFVAMRKEPPYKNSI